LGLGGKKNNGPKRKEVKRGSEKGKENHEKSAEEERTAPEGSFRRHVEPRRMNGGASTKKEKIQRKTKKVLLKYHGKVGTDTRDLKL